jgi:predicted RNase H-like HicB family nuclease
MRFTAVITREGPWFVARCLEVEVASQGEAVESALANLREALELKLEDEPELAPSQESPLVTTVEVTPRSSAA